MVLLGWKTNTPNARSEEIFEKKTYSPHVHERCLILADGFFEPHTYPDGSKQAYFCYIPDAESEDGRKLFCMAGLFNSSGEGNYYTTLLTTEAMSFFQRSTMVRIGCLSLWMITSGMIG